MLGDLGCILTALAFVATVYGGGAAFVSIRRSDPRWWESARHAFYGAAALLGLAIVVLVQAFLSNDFGIRYVVQHSSRVLPGYLKVSAVWAGQEGSLLLWSFLQALFAALAIGRPGERVRSLAPWAAVVLGVIGAFFIGVSLLLSNPFAMLPAIPADGQGMNPLLRHPGMIFHPPAMYVGYVGLAIPFAYAMASLIAGGNVRWTTGTRTWTLVAWLGLSLGLLLGMRWAYDVLGWGGYWGWDPVENAGLMPWFTATALLHGAVMQDERRGFRIWNYVLVSLSFVLVLFGTFATRSGVIQSVHAYAASDLGAYFLGAIVVTLAASAGLIAYRGIALRSETSTESLISRDGLFFLTVVLFLMLTVSVFVGSVLPTLSHMLTGQSFEAGPAWFDRVTGPQFGALVLLLGVCPLVGRAVAVMRRVRQWVWLAGIGAAIGAIAPALAGFTDPMSLIGFSLTGLAGATALIEFGEGAVRRARSTGEAPLNALWALLRNQRRKYGGYLVHLGVVLMAVGVLGTRLYPFERDVVLASGEPQQVGDYTLVMDMMSQERVDDHVSTSASINVYDGTEYLVTLVPKVDRYDNYDQPYSVPALRPALKEDLYLILSGWDGAGTSATVRVVVNALANFLWAGGLVFLAGGAMALWPRSAKVYWNVLAGVTAAGLLIGSGWSMWGAPHGAVSSGGQRPAVGQPAPDFQLALLDGSATSLASMRGEVVVLNIWAPWCPTCRDNLPVLEDIWTAYRNRGVAFVGAAYQTDRADMEESVDLHGLTYPVGLDAGDRIAEAYGITGVPETFVVDAEGRIAYVHIGPVAEAVLRAELDALLEGRQ